MEVLFQAIVSAKITLENEYMALVFTADKLRHPMLHNIPCQPRIGFTDYAISTSDFLALRVPAIEGESISIHIAAGGLSDPII